MKSEEVETFSCMGDMCLFVRKLQMEFVQQEVLHFLFDLFGTVFCAVTQDDEVIGVSGQDKVAFVPLPSLAPFFLAQAAVFLPPPAV